MRMKPSAVACLFAVVLFGCGASRSFQVEAKNQTTRPVTLWLTKDGPPAEDGWRTPEDLAAAAGVEHEPQYDFAVVEPGRTGYTDRVSGKFPQGTHAVLRVYDGAVTYFQIADAAKTHSDRRADYVLKPGTNRVTVRDQLGRLVVERAD